MPMGRMFKVKPNTDKAVSKPIKRYVNRVVRKNTELKGYGIELPSVFASVGTTWNEQVMLNPAQGTAEIQRVGRKIKIHSIEVKGVLAQGSNETALDDSYNVMRIVIGLFDGDETTPLATAGANMHAIIQKQYATRGALLRKFFDKYIVLNVQASEPGDGDGYAPQVKSFNYYKRFKKPITMTWGDDTVNYPDQKLMMCVLSDSNAVVNPGFIAGYWMVRYTDA